MTAAGVRHLVFLTGESLVSLAPADGKLLCSYPCGTVDAATPIGVATPIAVDDYPFISAGYQKGCALLKVVRDGSDLRIERVYESRAMTSHFSTCVFYREHLFGFTDAGMLTCMEFRTGKILWRHAATARAHSWPPTAT